MGFKCNVCGKACISRRGLTRHFNSKHGKVEAPSINNPSSLSLSSSTEKTSLRKLHPLQLKAIVLKCAEKVFSDECFPPSFRQKFAKESFSFTNDDAIELWSKLRNIVDSFKGDAEKFYSGFYSLLVDNVLPSKFDETPDTNALMAEVTTRLLIHLSGDKLACLELLRNQSLCLKMNIKVYNTLLDSFYINHILNSYIQQQNEIHINNILPFCNHVKWRVTILELLSMLVTEEAYGESAKESRKSSWVQNYCFAQKPLLL